MKLKRIIMDDGDIMMKTGKEEEWTTMGAFGGKVALCPLFL